MNNNGYRSPQESFWAGQEGDSYVGRHVDSVSLARRIAYFARILSKTPGVGSVLEIGANVGFNLKAIRALIPDAEITAVEINKKAAKILEAAPEIDRVVNASVFDCGVEGEFDLVLSSGFLIHVNPDRLPEVYDFAFARSKRYIVFNEFYNPTPVEVHYRGHEEQLFKRDFAGEIMDRHPSLELIDYGFCYRRDTIYEMPDHTWFLMGKR